MANPFAGVIEACGQVGGSFDPENALRVQEWYDGLGEFVSAVVGMFHTHGDKLENDFYLDPAAGAYAQGLAGVFGRFHAPVDAAAATFKRVHEEDLERINNPKNNQDKWDISKNRS